MSEPIPFPRDHVSRQAATAAHLDHIRQARQLKPAQGDFFVPHGALFIDYVTCKLPLDWTRPINDGMFLSLKNVEGGDPRSLGDDALLQESDVLEAMAFAPQGMKPVMRIHKRKAVEGSWSSRILLRTVQRGWVEFKGNPTKFLQGHNVFGSDDLCGLVAEAMRVCLEKLGMEVPTHNYQQWLDGHWTMSRVDVTAMMPFEDKAQVTSVIRALSETVYVKWRGRGLFDNGTLYHPPIQQGKRASRWQLVMYSKGVELENAKEPIPDGLPHRSEIIEWAQDKLRVELRLLSDILKQHGVQSATMWSSTVARELFCSYFAKLEIGDAVVVKADDVSKLKRCLKHTYERWTMGYDLRDPKEMPPATFKRHRKLIQEQLGVDIGVCMPKSATVIPLRKAVVIGNFQPAPAWADSRVLFRRVA